MVTESQIKDFLYEQLFKPLLGDFEGGWINWITFTLIFEAILLLFLLIFIRVISGRRTIKVKLITPKLPKIAKQVPEDKLAMLKALIISTNGAQQILQTLQNRKKIGSAAFEQISSIYKEQLNTVESRLMETLDSAEFNRLQQLYDDTPKPTTPVTTKSVTPPLIGVTEAITPPSGPPAAPSAPSSPPSGAPSGPPKGKPKGMPPPPPSAQKKGKKS